MLSEKKIVTVRQIAHVFLGWVEWEEYNELEVLGIREVAYGTLVVTDTLILVGERG